MFFVFHVLIKWQVNEFQLFFCLREPHVGHLVPGSPEKRFVESPAVQHAVFDWIFVLYASWRYILILYKYDAGSNSYFIKWLIKWLWRTLYDCQTKESKIKINLKIITVAHIYVRVFSWKEDGAIEQALFTKSSI